MIGQVIDKYEVLQKLGEGATATVYRGRHLTIGKDVAIKVLHPHLSASSRYRERFNREARAVGRLSHQNIVSILDYSGQSAEDCYIVTELIDGVTLLHLIEEHGHLPSEIAAMLGAELCDALGFAHTQGVIHRDIKPENVMIRRDGRVKLMDFGVARVLDEGQITLDGSLLGSPAYMSPQQAMDGKLDGRSDLFSLGTVLFHAVTGSVPFAGSNASVILRNIIDGTRAEVLELNPQVAPALAAVIDRLLQANPDDRYTNAEAARDALLACLAEVDLAPDHPTINLHAWLVNPRDCHEALDAWLRERLLTKGKARLAAQDTLGALQLFNRLLAIDEENSEVIALVQSLHQPLPTPRRTPWIAAAGAGLLLLASLGGWWWMGHREVAPVTPPPPPSPTVDVVPTEPVVPPPVAEPAAPVEKPTEPAPTPIKVITSQVRPPATPQATTTPPATVEAKPATVTITGDIAEDVLVDDKRIGSFRVGKPPEWVGTSKRPIELSPGKHKLEFRNHAAEPQIEELTLDEGEVRRVVISFRRKPVWFTVNARLPTSCTVKVGSIDYKNVRNFPIRDPDPSALIHFECPPPYGAWTEVVGPTVGGDQKVIPVKLPEGVP